MPLYVKIIIGLALGIIWSFISSFLGWNQFTIDWINPFGDIFIRLLKFIAVPLVLFSIISGVAGLNDISRLGKMGGKTILIYLGTTVFAVTMGLLIGNVFQPGSYIDEEQKIKNRISYEQWAIQNNIEIIDGKLLSNDPKYKAYIDKKGLTGDLSESDLENVEKKMNIMTEKKSRGPLRFLVDMVPENIILSISDNRLMLQVIFFAIFFGITLVLIPSEKAKPVIDFINSSNEVFLKMVDIVMKAAPYFVFALMAGVVAKMADTPEEVLEIFISLGSYSLAVFLGLIFMIFVFYPTIIRWLVALGMLIFSEK